MSFIHIGLHKAGSTFVQAELLPKLKKISPLTFYDNKFLSDEILYLSECSDLFYNNKIESKIHSSIKNKNNLFISSEALSGTGYNIYTAGYMLEQIAQRLKKIFKFPKILIIIREQKACIESLYKDDVKYGFLGDFENWYKNRYQNCQLNYFKYYNIIKLYQKIFGSDNVNIMLFENLFDIESVKAILIDMGIEPDGIENVDFSRRFNESYSPLSFKLTFLINRLFGSKLTHGVTFGKDPRLGIYNLWRYNLSKKIDRISYALNINKVKLDFKGYDEMVYELFHEDNQKLAELTGIDISKYEYI